MKKYTINCDMGEGVYNEAAIMPFIDYCNIACGGHTGDTSSMIEIIELALKYKVMIGAHPSYPDRLSVRCVNESFAKVELNSVDCMNKSNSVVSIVILKLMLSWFLSSMQGGVLPCESQQKQLSSWFSV